MARIVPEGAANLDRIGQAVADLRAGRVGMSQRRGFKAPSDREIKEAIKEGRP